MSDRRAVSSAWGCGGPGSRGQMLSSPAAPWGQQAEPGSGRRCRPSPGRSLPAAPGVESRPQSPGTAGHRRVRATPAIPATPGSPRVQAAPPRLPRTWRRHCGSDARSWRHRRRRRRRRRGFGCPPGRSRSLQPRGGRVLGLPPGEPRFSTLGKAGCPSATDKDASAWQKV